MRLLPPVGLQRHDGSQSRRRPGSRSQCQTCHTTTAWPGATFNHSQTSFPLTGSHVQQECLSCHGGGVYNGLSTQCASCHQSDYNGTTDPNHTAAGFPLQCQTCHNTTTWQGATFDHDSQNFPIYSGRHRDKWDVCTDCHTNATNYSVFSCLGCHPHSDKWEDRLGSPGRVGLQVRQRGLLQLSSSGSGGLMFEFIRGAILLLAALLGLSTVAGGRRHRSLPPAPTSVAHVTYITGGLVYLDAGREDGLEVGRELSVEREGAVIATIRVEHVASHRASCSIVGTGEAPREGDVVRYAPRPGTESGDSTASSAPIQVGTGRDGRTLRQLGLRGRVGIRYLTALDQTDFGADFTQPSLDLLLTGTAVAGSPFSFALDTRARRTYRTHADGSHTDDGRTRVYRLNASHQATGSPLRISLGRQVSPDLASVSLFDGALAEYGRATTAWGLFGGATSPIRSRTALARTSWSTGPTPACRARRGTRSGGRPPGAGFARSWTVYAIAITSSCAGSSWTRACTDT